MPPLPNANTSPYPSYPNQANPSMPMPSSYPRQSMPQAPFGAGFIPPQNPSGFVGGGGGFMPQVPQMPNAYPPSSTTVYPPHPNMPTHNPNSHNLPPHQGYTGYGYQQVPSSGPSCPIVNNMAPSFSQMQGHIRDVRRSKVRVYFSHSQHFAFHSHSKFVVLCVSFAFQTFELKYCFRVYCDSTKKKEFNACVASYHIEFEQKIIQKRQLHLVD